MTATGLLLVLVGVGILLGRWGDLRKRRRGDQPAGARWRAFLRHNAPMFVASETYYDRLIHIMWVPGAAFLLIGLILIVMA